MPEIGWGFIAGDVNLASSTGPTSIIPQLIMEFYVPASQCCNNTPAGYSYGDNLPVTGINKTINNIASSGIKFAHNGIDTWVATDGTNLYSSSDANTWTLRSSNTSVMQNTIRYLNGYFCFLYYEGPVNPTIRLRISSDGINWSAIKIPSSNIGNIYLTINYNSGYFIIGGLTTSGGLANSIYTNSNPNTWVLEGNASPSSWSVATYHIRQAIFTNNVWLFNLVYSGGVWSSSSNPITASSQPSTLNQIQTVTTGMYYQMRETASTIIFSGPAAGPSTSTYGIFDKTTSSAALLSPSTASNSWLKVTLGGDDLSISNIANNMLVKTNSLSGPYNVWTTTSASPTSSANWINNASVTNTAAHDSVGAMYSTYGDFVTLQY